MPWQRPRSRAVAQRTQALPETRTRWNRIAGRQSRPITTRSFSRASARVLRILSEYLEPRRASATASRHDRDLRLGAHPFARGGREGVRTRAEPAATSPGAERQLDMSFYYEATRELAYA